jgi:DNA-directed RNA polymerase alpha subunit
MVESKSPEAPPAIEPVLSESPSLLPGSTPLSVLGLSLRPYNALMRADITDIGQLAAMSREQIREVHSVGEKGLTEIEEKLKAYLAEHPVLDEVEEGSTEPETQAAESLPPQPPSQPPDPIPLGILGLSGRPHFALMQAGITTIGQLAAMSREQIREVRNVSEKGLTEIEEKLAAYLAEHLLPNEAEEGTPKPDAQVAEPIPPQPLSPPLDPTPLDVLGLSTRPHNVLRRADITTIGQLAAMSREQIRKVRNVGKKSLAEIEDKLKAYLAVHPLPTKPKPPAEESKPPLPPPPLADPEMLNSARDKGIPLDEISVERLALPESLQILLHRANIETVGELTLQPREKWRRRVSIIQHLNRYLAWLVEQDETAWANEVAGRDISPLHWLELTETSLEDLAGKWLSVLDSRDNQVVCWRYGLEGEELTLEEVGERLNITRERVRQIQNRARRALEKPQSRAVIRPLRKLLLYLLEQAGGLMNEAQLEAALRRELVIGDVDPVGVARLVLDLHDGFEWIREAQSWGLTRFPLVQVPSINRHLAEVLEKAYVPLPSDRVVARFKETRFYQNRRDVLDDAFIVACIKTHPTIEVDSSGMCGLTKWVTRKPDKIVLALQQIGHPVHYSVLVERVNALLPPDQQTLAQNIQAILNRYPNIFVHLGRGKYWLRGHLIEEASASPQADFGDLFGARLTRWQAELDHRQGSCELDTHTEVDIIRNVGLDFFTE